MTNCCSTKVHSNQDTPTLLPLSHSQPLITFSLMLNFPYPTQKLLGPMDCFHPGLIGNFSINLKKDDEKITFSAMQCTKHLVEMFYFLLKDI